MTQTNCTAPARIRLSEFSLICVTGADRIAFLQGQLTNDITKLVDGTLMTAGYCSPKGRLLATPRLFCVGESVYLIVPANQAETLIKRLKMFVMRSKVTLSLVEDKALYATFDGNDKSSLGLTFELSNGAETVLDALNLPKARYLIVDTPDLDAETDTSLFEACEIAAGRVWVNAATTDQFVPQAVNLECIGGVSFSKGCYTGQEIVSRVEHIGKTNRRVALCMLEGALTPAPMTDVVDFDGNPVGVVVQSAPVNGKTLALVQLSVADIENPDFKARIHDVEIKLYNLPYLYQRAL